MKEEGGSAGCGSGLASGGGLGSVFADALFGLGVG